MATDIFDMWEEDQVEHPEPESQEPNPSQQNDDTNTVQLKTSESPNVFSFGSLCFLANSLANNQQLDPIEIASTVTTEQLQAFSESLPLTPTILYQRKQGKFEN